METPVSLEQKTTSPEAIRFFSSFTRALVTASLRELIPWIFISMLLLGIHFRYGKKSLQSTSMAPCGMSVTKILCISSFDKVAPSSCTYIDSTSLPTAWKFHYQCIMFQSSLKISQKMIELTSFIANPKSSNWKTFLKFTASTGLFLMWAWNWLDKFSIMVSLWVRCLFWYFSGMAQV